MDWVFEVVKIYMERWRLLMKNEGYKTFHFSNNYIYNFLIYIREYNLGIIHHFWVVEIWAFYFLIF